VGVCLVRVGAGISFGVGMGICSGVGTVCVGWCCWYALLEQKWGLTIDAAS